MEDLKYLLVCIAIFAFIIVGIIAIEKNYNGRTHNNDVLITEWISPDGVHYWYQQSGYHAMLAPRYDRDGNLVIDKEN